MKKLFTTKTGAVAAALILLVVLVLINCVVAALPYSVTRLDMSGTGLYSVSGATKTFLKDLTEDVTIWCITKDGHESDQLSTILSRYTAGSPHIRVKYVKNGDEAFAKKYGLENTAISESSMVIESEKRYTYLDYQDLIYYYTAKTGKLSREEYALAYSYATEGYDYLMSVYGNVSFADIQAFFDGEARITNAIEYVTRENISFDVPLSAATRKFISDLTGNVQIYFVTSNRDTVLTGLLEEMADLNRGITLTFVDPNRAADAERIAPYLDGAKPAELTVIFAGENRHQLITWDSVACYYHEKLGMLSAASYSYMLQLENTYYESMKTHGYPYGYCYSIFSLIQTYGEAFESHISEIYNITAVTEFFDGTEAYLNALDYVTQPTVPHPYFLTGHGETGFEAKLLEYAQKSGAELGTLEGAYTIPADASSILIVNPSSDLEEAEATALLAYLEKGGHLLLFTSPDAVHFPNLMRIAAQYGVTAAEGTVTETDSKYYTKEDPTFLTPTVYAAHQINYICASAGYEMWMPHSHALLVAETLPEKVTVVTLLRSSETARLCGDNGEILGEASKNNPYTIAVDIQNESTGAKILWYGSADAVTDRVCADETDTNDDKHPDCGNIYYLALAVSYLASPYTPEHTTVAPIATATLTADAIRVSGAEMTLSPLLVPTVVSVLLGILLVGVIPFGLLAIGIVRTVKRRNR